MLVAVSGRLQTRTWEDKQGNKRKAVEVVADEVFFAESKKQSSDRQQDHTSPGDFEPLEGEPGDLPF